MSPQRLLAFSLLVALTGPVLVALAWGNEPPRPTAVPPTTVPPATTQPDLATHIEFGNDTSPVLEKEAALTRLALARSTSTTTTTITPTTTTTTTATTTTMAPVAITAAVTTTVTTATTTTTSIPESTAPSTTTTLAPQAPPPSVEGAGCVPAAESEFTALINQYRSGSGLAAMIRENSLDAHARSWAKQMAAKGDLAHSKIGILVPPWNAAGENVGHGDSVDSIFEALVSSSGHSSNMLNDYTHMGVGACRSSDGALWTVHVFAG